jgi:hypothetical protein
MAGVPGVMLARLRARREEIEEAIFARVRGLVFEPMGERDMEYLAGLRATVAVAVGYGLSGIEGGEAGSVSVPGEVLEQARLAARNGISLDVVLRRYIAGNALLWDYIMQEATRAELAGEGEGLREMLRAQSSLFDALVILVAGAHTSELQRTNSSGELRLEEQVRMLLAGRPVEPAGLGYELEGEHLGVIAVGPGGREALGDMAESLGCGLLCVPCERETVWAWLGGGRCALPAAGLEHLLAAQAGAPGGAAGADTGADRVGSEARGVMFAVGESARGLAGWRLTHRQAQAALLVARRRWCRLTRYGDVALLAAALKDDTLARSLVDLYLSPLEDSRNGGGVLRDTLRAYLAAECNATSAAAALGVVRRTVENRLRIAEERLCRSLHPCPAELEVALGFERLYTPPPPIRSAVENALV